MFIYGMFLSFKTMYRENVQAFKNKWYMKFFLILRI